MAMIFFVGRHRRSPARTRCIATRAPPPAPNSISISNDHAHARTGIFFDGDNVSPRQYQNVIDHVRATYSPAPKVVRAYRDCRDARWGDACERLGVEAVHVPRVPHKNSSDIYMACDMMDLMPALDTFVIATNDSDFRHVAVVLRRNGKHTAIVTVNGGSRFLPPWSDDHHDAPAAPRTPKNAKAADPGAQILL